MNKEDINVSVAVIERGEDLRCEKIVASEHKKLVHVDVLACPVSQPTSGGTAISVTPGYCDPDIGEQPPAAAPGVSSCSTTQMLPDCVVEDCASVDGVLLHDERGLQFCKMPVSS